MDKAQAIKLVENVFDHAFSEEKFVLFCSNLLNELDKSKATPVQSGNYVYEPYRNHIKSFRRIGQYTDPEGELLDVLSVKVVNGNKLERTRTGLRNFAIEYLKRKDARDTLLIAFHSDDSPDWRFSFVKLEYTTYKDEKGKIKARQEATSARRYSFLVGENEPCHTAKRQLLPLLIESEVNPTLAQIEHCFNIEKVTKEFFEQYKALFVDLQEHLDSVIKKDKKIAADFESKNIESSSFAKKLLGQIVFLYFIQKKGWLGVPKDKSFGQGEKRFLKSLFGQTQQSNANYFNDYLEPLFYEALAVQRSTVDPSYYKRFNCRIPFLNGGLFEPIRDYDWQNTDINIPNEVFSNTLLTKEGDIGTGILDIFDRYNFTVKEDEPLEKEVAVDPEMLGKVFENLLEVKDRKSKGAYYTPREIVHYMCQESLINYLDTALNSDTGSFQGVGENQTDLFGNRVRKGQLKLEMENKEIKVPKEDIDAFIKNSHLVVEDNRKKDSSYTWQLPKSIQTHAKLFDKALAEIKVCDPAIGSGAFPVGMLNEIVKARTALTPYMGLKNEDEGRTQYHLKRECIQNSLYGVDIDESAIDIAKLRLWLSLVVDEDSIQDIEPLPNLDYKIVCGNSLLGLPDGVMHNDGLEKEIEELKKEYFSETDNKEKRKHKKAINEKFKDILKSMRIFSKDIPEITFDFKIHFSEVWHGQNGFDVVIGNPPYVPGKDISVALKKEIKERYQWVTGKYDLYIVFVEKGVRLLNTNGSMSFIIPNTLLVNENACIVRKELVNKSLLSTVRIYKEQVFDATVESVVLLIESSLKNKLLMVTPHGDRIDLFYKQILSDKFHRYIIPETGESANVLKKIESNSIPLGDISDICIGIQVGGSGLSSEFKSKYLSDEQIDSNYKPVLDGKDYVPFKTKWKHNYIKYGDWLHRKRDEKYFLNIKLMIRQVGSTPVASIDYDNFYTLNTIYNVLILNKAFPIEYVFALINSMCLKYYWSKKLGDSKTFFPKIKKSQIEEVPVFISGSEEKSRIAAIVKRAFKINKQNIEVNSNQLACEIDARVANLYSLTESEYQLILEDTEDTFRITALNYFRDIQKGILK